MAKPILKRLVEQLRKKGMSEKTAYAIAVKKLQESGNLKKNSTEMTQKGVRRSKMGAAERAKDRAAKKSGRKASKYVYNSKTNRATLKKT